MKRLNIVLPLLLSLVTLPSVAASDTKNKAVKEATPIIEMMAEYSTCHRHMRWGPDMRTVKQEIDRQMEKLNNIDHGLTQKEMSDIFVVTAYEWAAKTNAYITEECSKIRRFIEHNNDNPFK